MPKGYSHEYYVAHKESIVAAKARYEKKNRDKVNAYHRRWQRFNMFHSPRAARNLAFGEALRRWRKDRGMTQEALGRVLGLSDTWVCYCENGSSPKPAERFRDIPELYEILKEVEREFESRAS